MSTRPQQRFHARAGIARPGEFEHRRLAQPQHEALVLEKAARGDEVEAGNDEVASKVGCIHLFEPTEGGDDGQVFGLDQGDLPLPPTGATGRTRCAAVSCQPTIGNQLGHLDRVHRRHPGGAQVDGLDAARSRESLREVTQ